VKVINSNKWVPHSLQEAINEIENLKRQYAEGLEAWKANNEYHQKQNIELINENLRLRKLLRVIDKSVNNALNGEIK
jgi:hypothetical protein